MLQLVLHRCVAVAEEDTQSRVRVYPAGKVVLQICLATQLTQLLQHFQLDLSAKVQGRLFEDGIITRQDDLLQRYIVLIALGVMNPSSKHHATVFLRTVRIAQVFRVHIIYVYNALVLDVHTSDG